MMKFLVIFIFIQGIFPSLAQGGECEKSFSGDKSISNTYHLTNNEIKNFTPSEIRLILIEEIKNFTTEQIPLFSPEQIQSFTSYQISHFLISHIRAFTKEQLQALTSEHIQALRSDQIMLLKFEQWLYFLPEQLREFHFFQLKDLSVEHVHKLANADKIQYFKPTAQIILEKILLIDVSEAISPGLNNL